MEILSNSAIQKLKIVTIIRSVMKQEEGRFQNWLAYSPMLYNHLLMISASHMNQISQVQWLRGVTHARSSFKFQQGYICLSGSANRNSRSGGKQGAFSVYKCSMPIGEELDDDRLDPIVKLRSHWCFEQEIDLLQQFGNGLEDMYKNNLFAVSYKGRPVVNLVSTRKLLEEGVHSQYVQAGCTKLQDHKQPITAIKWANIEKSSYKLFTASQDTTIINWDIQKIIPQRQMRFHRESVQAITPFFEYSSTWGDGPAVRNVGTTLASASTDGYIAVWDQKSATPVSKINAKQRELYALDCVSQCMLLSGGADGSIKMWDLRNSKEYLYDSKVDKVQGHTKRIRSIKVSRLDISKSNSKIPQTGRIKFSSSSDDGKIIEWQQKISFIHEGHDNTPTFDLLDGKNLCASSQVGSDMVMIWQSGISLTQSQY